MRTLVPERAEATTTLYLNGHPGNCPVFSHVHSRSLTSVPCFACCPGESQSQGRSIVKPRSDKKQHKIPLLWALKKGLKEGAALFHHIDILHSLAPTQKEGSCTARFLFLPLCSILFSSEVYTLRAMIQPRLTCSKYLFACKLWFNFEVGLAHDVKRLSVQFGSSCGSYGCSWLGETQSDRFRLKSWGSTHTLQSHRGQNINSSVSTA